MSTKSGWARPGASIAAPQPENGHQVSPDTATNVSSMVSCSGDSSIPRGMMIRGDITGSGSLLIEGVFEGNIRLEDSRVTVGRGARVEGSIVARDVVVMGQMRGTICAAVRAEVRAEGAVAGEVVTPRVIVEFGASLQSKVDMRRPESGLDFKSVLATPILASLKRPKRKAPPIFLPVSVRPAKEAGLEREGVAG